jgi:hypothetical protein
MKGISMDWFSLGISKSKLNSIKNIAVISNDLIIQDDLGSIEVLSIF